MKEVTGLPTFSPVTGSQYPSYIFCQNLSPPRAIPSRTKCHPLSTSLSVGFSEDVSNVFLEAVEASDPVAEVANFNIEFLRNVVL